MPVVLLFAQIASGRFRERYGLKVYWKKKRADGEKWRQRVDIKISFISRELHADFQLANIRARALFILI